MSFDRGMDAGDQAYWTGQIASGVARSQIAELIAKSQENYLIVVSQLYQSVLGRTAETEGIATSSAMRCRRFTEGPR